MRRFITAVVIAGVLTGTYSLHAADEELRTNAFHDPFGVATSGMPGCSPPAGPLYTEDEARRESHYRVERGTSCYMAGRCRLPNAHNYDAEIFPRAVQTLRRDGRFDDTSIWLTVQRRWVTAQGCVKDAEQGKAIESLLQRVDDVDAVLGNWMIGAGGVPPYEVAQPAR